MKEIKNQTVQQLIDGLSAKTSVPGGGSASAIAGSMAASLVIMVAEFTIGKEKYRAVEEKFKKIKKRAERLKKELLALADQDAEAYSRVVKACRAKKERAIQAAYQEAARVPLKTAQQSLKVLEMVAFAKKNGNQNLGSDALVAIQLAKTAIRGGLENVKVNLPYLKNKKETGGLEKEVRLIQKKLREI